jgi:hypothetical protein
MAPAFNRLLHFGRRGPGPDASLAEPVAGPAVDVDAMPLEGATLASAPGLVPAAIFRQVLFDPTEFTPAWLRPRLAPAQEPATPSAPVVEQTAVANAAPADERKPATRPRRPKAKTPSAAKPTRSKRAAKTDHDPA